MSRRRKIPRPTTVNLYAKQNRSIAEEDYLEARSPGGFVGMAIKLGALKTIDYGSVHGASPMDIEPKQIDSEPGGYVAERSQQSAVVHGADENESRFQDLSEIAIERPNLKGKFFHKNGKCQLDISLSLPDSVTEDQLASIADLIASIATI
mgnify:CR=1 FL=1